MEVTQHYTLLTLLFKLFTMFILSNVLYIAKTVECMPILIGRNVRTLLEWAFEQNVGLDWTGGMGDSYDY